MPLDEPVNVNWSIPIAEGQRQATKNDVFDLPNDHELILTPGRFQTVVTGGNCTVSVTYNITRANGDKVPESSTTTTQTF
jgi:hypothetical protein